LIEGAYLWGFPAAGAASDKPFCRRFQLKVGSVTLLESWNLINGLKLWVMEKIVDASMNWNIFFFYNRLSDIK
jgi:hypothetical protein